MHSVRLVYKMKRRQFKYCLLGGCTLRGVAKGSALGFLHALRILRKAGLPEEKPVLVYKSMIHSILEYAIEVWSDLPTYRYLSVEMEKVQKRALRIIFPNIEYGEALETSSMKSLAARREILCKNYLDKLEEPKNNTVKHTRL